MIGLSRVARTLALVVVFAACAGRSATDTAASTSSTTEDAAARGDTLSIPLGETRTADQGKLQIRFDARVADSRCPANVMCVWAGDAHVRIAFRVGSGSFTAAELHSTLEPKTVSAGPYVLTMVGMTPYPGTGRDGDRPVLILSAKPK